MEYLAQLGLESGNEFLTRVRVRVSVRTKVTTRIRIRISVTLRVKVRGRFGLYRSVQRTVLG